MASQAKVKFDALRARAQLLATQGAKLRLKADLTAKEVLLHAALAGHVAAWDAYVKALATEYIGVIRRNGDAGYSTLHVLVGQRMNEAIKKLNTPNSNNTRNFLLAFANFDPWPHWINIRFGATLFVQSLLVRDRLDEIFKVRHSFAHGLTIPALVWNSDPAGNAKLTAALLRDISGFFNELCTRTDQEMSRHIVSSFSISPPW